MAAVQAPNEEAFFDCAHTDLKRLAFVETAASNSVSYVTGSTAFAKACSYYSSAKETNALKVRACNVVFRRDVLKRHLWLVTRVYFMLCKSAAAGFFLVL